MSLFGGFVKMQRQIGVAFISAGLVCTFAIEQPVEPHLAEVLAGTDEYMALDSEEEAGTSMQGPWMRNEMSWLEQEPLRVLNATEMAERRQAAPGPPPLLSAFLFFLLVMGGAIGNDVYNNRGKSASPAGDTAAEGEDAQSTVSDSEQLTAQGLPEDTYGMTIASLIRDSQHMVKENAAHYRLRVARIVTSMLLLLLNMVCQVYLLVCIGNFSAASAVMTIRKGYDAFEKHMYGGNVYINSNGMARGLEASFFKTENFATLSEDVKGVACKIPFSQPNFLFLVLFIWTLMIVGELRSTSQMFNRLVVKTETSATMANATEPGEDQEVVIKRLTIPVKVVITLCVVIPRACINIVLLWMGCRWLAATTDFQNLVLNSVGLEFMMLLKDLMYNSLVPDRSKRDTTRMTVNVAHESTPPSPFSFLGTFVWGFAAILWVIIYIHSLQQVLPEYRWDVQEVCVPWMKENYASLR
eukprot:TRINITY_DN3010_c0_g2_i1.p1 TRINITY_DN3010_c0_g2~~TRINITY_DN3010_c0_g2_i1.p1  ORF type:complete len:469 (-),score=101.01 TRINITY_DN3010_c0_g2_i1:120-1526(-)